MLIFARFLMFSLQRNGIENHGAHNPDQYRLAERRLKVAGELA